VRLRGPRGNPTGVGARVTAIREDGRVQAAEVYAGSGYLSQSTSTLFFGIGTSPIRDLRVRWPGGLETTTPLEGPEREKTIEHPDA